MDKELASRTMSKVVRRFLPLLFVCFVVSFLDRVNIGFAALTMNSDLGFSASIYGLGASLFFLTYVLFEVPSNLALEKYGARLWIARIMLSWGLISGLTAFVSNQTGFYAIRLLLGAAEAGFFPGVIYLLTRWVPPSYRGRFVGAFMAAMPIASVIGAPVSGFVLGMDGILGLHGWQWLFLLEALPAILLTPVVLMVLTDHPANSSWLKSDEQAWLARNVEASSPHDGSGHGGIWAVLSSPSVLLLALAWFGLTGVNYGLSFFLPQIIAAFGLSHVATGFLSALPFAVATVSMLVLGAKSDRTGERRKYICGLLSVAVIGLLGTAFSTVLTLKLFFLCVTSGGVFAALPLFWSLPPRVLSPSSYAAGIAMINALGNLSGVTQPYVMGLLKDRFGGFEGGLFSIAVFAALGVLIIWLVGRGLKEPMHIVAEQRG